MKILLHDYEDVARMSANNIIFITYSFRKKDNGTYSLEITISTKCDDSSVAVCCIRVSDDVDQNDSREIEKTKAYVKELTEMFENNGFKVIEGIITTDPNYKLAIPIKSLQEGGTLKKLTTLAIELKESDITVSPGQEPVIITMELTEEAEKRIATELQEKTAEDEYLVKKPRKKA